MTQSSLFEFRKLSLPGVFLIKPKIFSDARGHSVVIYTTDEFEKLGIATNFKQDFRSYSVKNVIRGLHFQRAPYIQDKLVRCTQGEIFDVAADHNPDSPTFGTHVSATLNAKEHAMLFVPGKYAHGFCVTSADAVVEYKIGGEYSPKNASGVLWSDPVLNIPWPTNNPILSEQDRSWEPLPGKG